MVYCGTGELFFLVFILASGLASAMTRGEFDSWWDTWRTSFDLKWPEDFCKGYPYYTNCMRTRPERLKTKLSIDVQRLSAASNPVYVMGNERNDVVLHCVPPGQMDTGSVQLYEWRTIDNKVVVNRRRKIRVDVNTGRLTIYNVGFGDSARLFCSAVLANEERATFTHNLLVLGPAVQGQVAKMSIDTPRKEWTSLGLRGPQCFPHPVRRKIIEDHYAAYVRSPLCMIPKEPARLAEHACKMSKVFYIDCDEGGCVNPNEESRCLVTIFIAEYYYKYNREESGCRTMSLKCLKKHQLALLGEPGSSAALHWYQWGSNYMFKKVYRYGNIKKVNIETDYFADCPKGWRVESNLVCVPCEPGTFARRSPINHVLSASFCKECPAGTVQARYSQPKCDRCPSGSVPNEEKTRCVNDRPSYQSSSLVAGQSSFSFAERVAKVDFEAVLAHAIKVTGYFGLTTRPTKLTGKSKKLLSSPSTTVILIIVGALITVILGVVLWNMKSKREQQDMTGDVMKEQEMKRMQRQQRMPLLPARKA